MAEMVGKEKQDEKAKMLAKSEKLKSVAVKEPSEVQVAPGPDEKAIQTKPEQKVGTPEADKKAVKETAVPQAEPVKKPEKAEAKPEAKKEADPAKEFVDGIINEMALKGASKKRLIRTLVEQYGMDRQKVMFKLKRALITERYAAAHAEAGGAGH